MSVDIPTLNQTIESISSKKNEWSTLNIDTKIKILEEMIQIAKDEGSFIHSQSCLSRGVDVKNKEHDAMNAHCWTISLVPWGGWLGEILIVYQTIKATGELPKPQKIYNRPNGQVACKVGPSDLITWLFCGTPSYEVILDKGAEAAQTSTPLTRSAGVVGILGAGNYDAKIDILSALFIQNKVAIYKTNPVGGEFMTAIAKTLCRPLIEKGYLAVVEGAGDVGGALLNHKLVDEWYVTGSKQTYNNIVWGNPAGPKSEDQQPNITKPCVAELGGCSPVIITPDSWGFLDMKFQIGHLSVFTVINGGHICVRPQAIITCKQWPQREEFVSKLKKKLQALPAWRSFYPGSFERVQHFADMLRKEGFSDADIMLHEPATLRTFGNGTKADNGGVDQLTSVTTGAGKSVKRHPMVFASVTEDSATLSEEAFCPVLLEVCLDTPAEYEAFLSKATSFCNEKLAGNLTASIVAKSPNHPSVLKAVDELKHGIVGVNVNGVNAIIQPALFWGGGRDSTSRDVQSGIGLFGNLYCLDRPVKALVTAPFFNMALIAQQAAENGSAQPITLFRRLAMLLLNRTRNMGPFKFIYWSVAVSLALFNI